MYTYLHTYACSETPVFRGSCLGSVGLANGSYTMCMHIVSGVKLSGVGQ